MSLLDMLAKEHTYAMYLKRNGEHRQLQLLELLQKQEQMTSFKIHQTQLINYHRMMEHIFYNSRFYNKIYRDRGHTPVDFERIEDLQKFPILTKKIIRENIDDILAKNYPKSKRAQSATGGSTGEPLVFWRDYKCRDLKQAMHLNFKRWYGYYPGDKQLFFWGALQDFDQVETLKSRIVKRLATRTWFISAKDIEVKNFKATVRRIRSLKPKLVLAYPNIIYAFAKQVKHSKLKLKFNTIVCSAEQLFDYQRDYIREIFKAEVFEKYGSREIGTIASECSKHNGMHYFAPGIILEVVNSDGQPSGDSYGRLLVTDLWNYAMPLIRYEVGDMVRLDFKECGCGCMLPKIADIAGRVVDMIVKPNGDMMAGQSLIAVIRKSKVPFKTQTIQKQRDLFIINYESKSEIAQKYMSFIQSEFNSVMGQEVTVDFQRRNQIKREKSGKFRYVKSEVKSPFKK